MYKPFIIKIKSSLAHRNHFLHLQQQKKFSESKVKLKKASNHCRSVLEAIKLAYANKRKESIPSQKLAYGDFQGIANSALNRNKYAITPLFNGLQILSSASHKAKMFAKTFLRTLILMCLEIRGASLPAFPSRTNLKLYNISVTPKLVKKVITLICQKHLVLIV